jgi:hypothetical protein
MVDAQAGYGSDDGWRPALPKNTLVPHRCEDSAEEGVEEGPHEQSQV